MLTDPLHPVLKQILVMLTGTPRVNTQLKFHLKMRQPEVMYQLRLRLQLLITTVA